MGRRVVDCLSCFNETVVNIVQGDTGKCLYKTEEQKDANYAPVLDYLSEYMEWIVLIVFLAISAVIIYVIWYTCCRKRENEAESPTAVLGEVPHLELHENQP